MIAAAVLLGVSAARSTAQPPPPPPGAASPGASAPSLVVGQELRLAPTTEEGVGAILGGLLGGRRDVSVSRVVVREESSAALSLEMTVKGLAAGGRVRADVRDRGRRRIATISGVAVPVPAAAESTVQIGFVSQRPPTPADPTAPLEFDSEFVTFVIDGGNGAPGAGTGVGGAVAAVVPLQLTYRLAKRWRIEPLPDDVVVRVAARGEGAAATLPAVEPGTLILPRQRIRILSEATLSPAVLGAATPAATPAAPAAVGPATAAGAVVLHTAGGPAVAGGAMHVARDLRTVDLRGSKMVALSSFQFGLDRPTADRGGRGPSATTLDLLEGLRSDVDLPREALTRVASRLFLDQNAASGVVYFLPESFSLSWTVDNGYALRMLYGASSGAGAGEVAMSATLSTGVDVGEVEVARQLLLGYQRRHPQLQFSELRPLPLAAAPAVSLGSTLSSTYSIPADRIVVNAISDALAGVDVAWATDAVTKENLQLALAEDVGWNGTVTLQPHGGLAAQSLPVRVRLADERTFGALGWRRGERWRNQTPYPARLKYLHVLLIDPNAPGAQNAPIVYSWNLGDAEVPPRAQVEIDAAAVPAWLDRKALRAWIEYVPLANCEECDRAVLRAVTGGVSAVEAGSITVHTITPLADTGAYELALEVRSRYFDPRSRDLVTKPVVVVREDGHDYSIGPIYVPSDGASEGSLFEYRLESTRADGTTRSGTRWIAADRLRLILGRVQVEAALAEEP